MKQLSYHTITQLAVAATSFPEERKEKLMGKNVSQKKLVLQEKLKDTLPLFYTKPIFKSKKYNLW